MSAESQKSARNWAKGCFGFGERAIVQWLQEQHDHAVREAANARFATELKEATACVEAKAKAEVSETAKKHAAAMKAAEEEKHASQAAAQKTAQTAEKKVKTAQLRQLYSLQYLRGSAHCMQAGRAQGHCHGRACRVHAVAYAGKGTACTPVARWGGCKRSAHGAGPERPRSNHGAITERQTEPARSDTELRGARARSRSAPEHGAAPRQPHGAAPCALQRSSARSKHGAAL